MYCCCFSGGCAEQPEAVHGESPLVHVPRPPHAPATAQHLQRQLRVLRRRREHRLRHHQRSVARCVSVSIHSSVCLSARLSMCTS